MGRNSKPKALKPSHPIVLVEWVDAESIDAWTSLDDVDHDIAPCLSVGFMVSKTKASVTLVLNHDQKNDNASCIMKIPTGMIVRMKILKP